MRASEKAISGEINGWLDVTLPALIEERNKSRGKALIAVERKVAIVNHKISALRKEQRVAIAALLPAERDIERLEKDRGKLVSLDEAKDLISNALLPAIIAIKRMPESGEGNREKTRLRALSESLLALLRDSARESVPAQPNGKMEAAECHRVALKTGDQTSISEAKASLDLVAGLAL